MDRHAPLVHKRYPFGVAEQESKCDYGQKVVKQQILNMPALNGR
jgi:hypothetical protein